MQAVGPCTLPQHWCLGNAVCHFGWVGYQPWDVPGVGCRDTQALQVMAAGL